MAVSDSMSVTVNATADQVLALIRDIDNQKNWFPDNEVSEVLERDGEGLPSKAKMTNHTPLGSDSFELTYSHTDRSMSWKLAKPTKMQRDHEGSWTLVDKGDKCEATLTLMIDSPLPVPGFLQRKTLKDVLKKTTNALAKQF